MLRAAAREEIGQYMELAYSLALDQTKSGLSSVFGLPEKEFPCYGSFAKEGLQAGRRIVS